MIASHKIKPGVYRFGALTTTTPWFRAFKNGDWVDGASTFERAALNNVNTYPPGTYQKSYNEATFLYRVADENGVRIPPEPIKVNGTWITPERRKEVQLRLFDPFQ